ncbi:hypothetical protein G6F42_010474 [Rhizopus arrhizus]|nr:hypothetical protein G6F42_010474 [Rhizopus arrhizus]
MEVTKFNAVPERVMMALDGLLNPTYSIVVTKSRSWFLILRGKFDSKMFDLIVYNSKTILKIIAHFETFLAGTQVQVYGEYATTAYSREKIAYPSHSVKVKALKCNSMVYEVEPTGDPSDNLLYDLLVAQKIYENWTDRSIRAARVPHEDFHDKYNKLHLDFYKTTRRRQINPIVGEFNDVFELESSVAKLKTTTLFKQSKLDSKIKILKKSKKTKSSP